MEDAGVKQEHRHVASSLRHGLSKSAKLQVARGRRLERPYLSRRKLGKPSALHHDSRRGPHLAFALFQRGDGASNAFGVGAEAVSPAQAAMLAGLLKAPTTFAPTNNLGRSQERAALVIGLMEAQGYLDEAQAADARANPASLQAAASARTARSSSSSVQRSSRAMACNGGGAMAGCAMMSIGISAARRSSE